MDGQGMRLPYGGLTSGEAARRAAEGKANKQQRAAGRSTLQILFANLFTLFNLLNLLLAAMLIAVGAYRNLLFMGVVISNALIGTVQELRAKHTIEKLRLLSAPSVQVVRDGKGISIGMEEVVLDDLIVARQGDQLCVDGELVFGSGAMNESLLTGESEPVDKRPGDAMLSGSFVTEGTLYIRVTKVGADSYASGLMAKARAIKRPTSQLMQSMRYIVRTVGGAIVPLGAILLYKHLFVLGEDAYGSVAATVAAMLGMIPEGLMLLTSMALAVGVVRLGSRNTLVNELYGIETLARVDTLCVDKTGTITKGTMAVDCVEPLGGGASEAVEERLGAMVAALDDNNATFAAIRERFAAPTGLKSIHTAPFSSARKWSAVVLDGNETCVLGAAEFILGSVPPALSERIAAHASEGKRVLLLACSSEPMRGKELPEGLAPLALVVLTDVLREDAAETLAYFAEQGVAVKVISGDNPVTVMNVAKQAGLENADKAVDACTLDTPQKLEQAAAECTVFGRVTPEQKKELVLAMKRQGHIVGMMGDGVNDIPALKASDCAIAMAGGSDAAQRVSQLTLLDARFSAVPHIVAEGRRVINNITRAASLFLVKTIFSFLLSLLLVFIHEQYPFSPIQMTLISSLTVGIPSFFLAMEPNNARVAGHFLYNVLRNALPGGLTIMLLIVLIFVISGPMGMDAALQSTMAVWVTGFCGLLVLLFTCRPLTWGRGILFGAMAIGFYGIGLFFGGLFYLSALDLTQGLTVVGLMVLAAPLMYAMRRVIARFAK